MPDAAEKPPPSTNAVFLTGSTMRHVVVMTTTGAIGLISIFAVDFLTLLYISWLRDTALTAAVGMASVILFIMLSINIGFMIAVGALVSRAIGQGAWKEARRIAGSAVAISALTTLVLTALAMPFLGPILTLLGAKGAVHEHALFFLWIVMPSNVLLAVGMALSGVLRACGDARRAMHVTLSAAIVTAIVDPILIFGLGLGLPGAAIAFILARIIFVLVGFRGAVGVHRLVEMPTITTIRADAGRVMAIALPAVLTNIASPVALGFLAAVMARFGDDAIAANTIIDRLTPLAFGVVFALSAAVGPILGQNLGAKQFHRVHRVLRDSLVFLSIYVGASALALALLRDVIPWIFGVEGRIAEFVSIFCLFSGPIWFFLGGLFVANAAFNNLGFPLYATAFNWGRAIFGTIPFVLVGAWLGGPVGIQIGLLIGAAIFGVASIIVAFRLIDRIGDSSKPQSVHGLEKDIPI